MQKLRQKVKNPRQWLFLSGLFCLMLFTVSDVNAVDYIMREANGVFHFNCVNACGPIRVRKSGKCEFFVQSIYYHGIVKACKVEIAARKACGELKFDVPKNRSLLNPACL